MSGKLSALRSLESRLKEIQSYMTLVSEGKLPINHEIMYQLQDVFNLLPNLNVHELVRAFSGEPDRPHLATCSAPHCSICRDRFDEKVLAMLSALDC